MTAPTRIERPSPPAVPGEEPSVGELVSRLGHDVTELIQAQVELAKVEVREQAREAGRAAAAGGVAVAVALAALVLLGMAAAWAIAEGWPTWSGFLIVGVVYAAIAAGLAAMARQRLGDATDGPTQTKQTLKEDAAWLRQHRS